MSWKNPLLHFNLITFSVSEETENISQLLPEYLEPGIDLWAEESFKESDISEDSKIMPVLVQWILKCSCLPDTPETTLSTKDVAVYRVHKDIVAPS